MRSKMTFVLAALAACGGQGGKGGAVRRDVGIAGATSLPAARVAYGDVALEQGPPIRLTTSDGTGLELTSLDARAVVDGPLAFTELRLTFANPEDRVLEGRFAITLPDGAAISRFAMKIDGAWMEAEVVERMAARRAYEDFLHRRQDPALLEKEAGNEFRARVFPIPARGVKELIVSYSQELADPDAPYVLPLRGLPRIRELAARVQVARKDGAAIAWHEVTLAERDWTPDRDLAARGSGASHALGAGGVVAMRVAPELPATAERFATATILVDTSASRALGFPAYARAVDALVAELAATQPGLEVRVAAFDQGVEELYAGPARDAAGKIDAALRGRMPLGGSDLAGALAWAKDARERLIVITDAVATAGELPDAAALGAARVDVVLAGGIRDRDAAAGLVRGGAVLELDAPAPELARRLALATRSGIAVEVDGASAVWPARLDGVQPGDAAMVYAWFDGAAPRTIGLRLGEDRRELAVEPAVEPLVARAAARARIARLEADAAATTDAAARAKVIAEIVAISTRERVLSDHTALLVLETEDDYRRFGIDRTALAGILAVGARGVVVIARKDVALIATTTPPPPRDEAADDGKERDKNEDGTQLEEEKPEAKKLDDAVALEPPAPPPAEPALIPQDGDRGDRDEPGVEGRGSASGAMRVEAARPALVAGGEAIEIAEREPRNAIPEGPPPYTGRMARVMELAAGGRAEAALDEALAWRAESPGDVLALVGLGEAFEAAGQRALAARAYGSLIDLFPARADLRRFAGERLDRLGDALAIDTYRRAVEQRPDHLTGHRLLAMALVRAGRHADAFAALEHGLAQRYPSGRFAGGERILREDLGLVAAAWLRAEPAQRKAVERRLRAAGAELARAPSTRFVLTWETDANDVDFHIRDAEGGHAYYSSPRLPSGGELYADVTTGYGPECFTIEGAAAAAPYRLSIHYYARGPMGYGMGKLEIVRHDGAGTLTFEQRPFVVMNDQAYVDLGEVR